MWYSDIHAGKTNIHTHKIKINRKIGAKMDMMTQASDFISWETEAGRP